MSIAYIRQYYRVPAIIRHIVIYRGERCKIVGTHYARLLLKVIDRKSRTMIVHPKDDALKYLEDKKP